MTSKLVQALSRLSGNRHSDGVSSLVSQEDRTAIIDGCYELMLASRLDTPAQPPAEILLGWTKVPEEPTLDFLKSINRDNQVLAYENGRYYNAWFEFEASEGGWFWTDDADSEPNPSHYRALGPIALAASEGSTDGS